MILLVSLDTLVRLEPSFRDMARERLAAIIEPLLHVLGTQPGPRPHAGVAQKYTLEAMISDWRRLASGTTTTVSEPPVVRCAWPACGRSDVMLRLCSGCGLLR